jgi:hypothetical protein
MHARISRAVCGTIVCAASTLTATSTQAAVLGNWGFEVNTPPDTTETFTNPALVNYQPDSGVSPNSSFGAPHVVGVHASAAAYTTPAGNGSANSFNSNTWATGDHYLFHLSSTGYQDITVEWDQTRSSTGPNDFKLEYSTDGVNYTQAGANLDVLQNGLAPNASWSSGGGVIAAYHFSRDLSSVTALNNATDLYIRVASLEAGAAAGTVRIDNFVINANLIPEPSSLGVLALGALMIRRRR